MKEKDSLLRALQSPDFNSVALARKNQAQKAKLRSKVINDLSNLFLISLSIFCQDEIIKMRDREIAILKETMKQETESEEEA